METINIDVRKRNAAKLISVLLHMKIQLHIFHLQAKGKSSFAIHSALASIYEDIVGFTDTLVETFQGQYNVIIEDYNINNVENFSSKEKIITYLEDAVITINNAKQYSFTDSDMLNIIDEINSLIKGTLYKLRFLE